MKKSAFLWILTGIVIAIGLVPYKFPGSFDTYSGDIIRVSHAECTCCGDFQILDGTLSIPKQFKDSLKKPFYEMNVIRKGSPFDNVTDENFVTTLYNNEFVLCGKIVGIDTFCGENRPIVQVNNWHPVHYRPIFLTSGSNYLVLYLVSSGIILILSTLFTVIKRRSR